MPLFNRREGDLDRARAEVMKQQAQLELTRRRIEKEVSVAVGQVLASRRIVERYQREIIPAQERKFGLLREGYELGEMRITDVFVGQREFIDGRDAYLETHAEAAREARTAQGYAEEARLIAEHL